MEQFVYLFLLGCCAVLGIAILLCMVRAIKGPRYADRIMSINIIGTMIIAILAMLSVALHADYLMDICIAYALLNFIAVVVLTRLVMLRHSKEQTEQEMEADK